MTASPPDTTPEEEEQAPEPSELEAFGAEVAEAVGGTIADAIGVAKIRVDRDRWMEAARTARDDFGMVYFDFLSAIDWSNDPAVGDPLEEETDERYEILCTLTELVGGKRVTFSTDVPKDDATIDSLVTVFPGANWHERETHEMFSVDFEGHPYLENLYLPDGFAGYPLQKGYPLLSREVKPWPGSVDVEPMPEPDEPTTENPEA